MLQRRETNQIEKKPVGNNGLFFIAQTNRLTDTSLRSVTTASRCRFAPRSAAAKDISIQAFLNNAMIQIRITLSDEVSQILEAASLKFGKKPAMLAREFMEQRMYELGLIQSLLK